MINENRLSIVLPEVLAEKLERYRIKEGISTKTEAALSLVRAGLHKFFDKTDDVIAKEELR